MTNNLLNLLPFWQGGDVSESITAPPSVHERDFDDETISVRSGTTNRSSSTFKTFATGFSNCSNVSFSKLYRGFTPNSALHREMLAVLAGTGMKRDHSPIYLIEKTKLRRLVSLKENGNQFKELEPWKHTTEIIDRFKDMISKCWN